LHSTAYFILNVNPKQSQRQKIQKNVDVFVKSLQTYRIGFFDTILLEMAVKKNSEDRCNERNKITYLKKILEPLYSVYMPRFSWLYKRTQLYEWATLLFDLDFC